jgi:hypothetical protein
MLAYTRISHEEIINQTISDRDTCESWTHHWCLGLTIFYKK